MTPPAITNPNVLRGTGDEIVATIVDDAVASAAMSGMSVAASAASQRRVDRADQLSADSAAMWTIFMTTPNAMTGVGYRTLQQSAGYPAAGGTGTGTQP